MTRGHIWLNEGMTATFGQSAATVSPTPSPPLPHPSYTPGCIGISSPRFKMACISLGQTEHRKKSRSKRILLYSLPKEPPKSEASRNIFKTCLFSWLLRNLCLGGASKLLLTLIHSISSKLGFLTGVYTSRKIHPLSSFPVIFPNGIEVQIRIRQHQEFGTLAISKLICWLGNWKKVLM